MNVNLKIDQPQENGESCTNVKEFVSPLIHRRRTNPFVLASKEVAHVVKIENIILRPRINGTITGGEKWLASDGIDWGFASKQMGPVHVFGNEENSA